MLNIFANQEKRDPISLFGNNQSVNLFKIKIQDVPDYHNKSIFNVTKASTAETEIDQNEGDDNSIGNFLTNLASYETNQSSFRNEPVEKIRKYDYKN